MPITVEDGSGVAGANSFQTAADLVLYAADRGIVLTATLAEQEAALVQAGDYLCNERRFRYRGQRVSSTQRMAFPRTGLTELNGPSYGDDEIPWRVKDAQAALATQTLVDGLALQPVLERGGAVQKSKVGQLETTYFPGADPETVYSEALGYLAPLLRTTNQPVGIPTHSVHEDETPYVAGEFDSPPLT